MTTNVADMTFEQLAEELAGYTSAGPARELLRRVKEFEKNLTAALIGSLLGSMVSPNRPNEVLSTTSEIGRMFTQDLGFLGAHSLDDA